MIWVHLPFGENLQEYNKNPGRLNQLKLSLVEYVETLANIVF